MEPLLQGLLMTPLLTAGSGAGTDDSLVLADFPTSMQDLKWREVNDNLMGGRSQGGFDLTFRWQKRPLVLFAADPGDERLRRQLSAVEASRERFDERDMALIVMLGASPSRAAGRALSPGDADRVRAAYGVDRTTFALRLVGKDGGVKREAADFVAMENLYDLIDSMPMRHEEMRRR